MTIEEERRFLLLLSSYALGNHVTKAQVLDKIDDSGWIVLSDDDLKMKHNRKELVWRNNLAFVRKHLALAGLYQSELRDDWTITEKGVNALVSLFQQAQVTPCSIITHKAISDAKAILSSVL